MTLDQLNQLEESLRNTLEIISKIKKSGVKDVEIACIIDEDGDVSQPVKHLSFNSITENDNMFVEVIVRRG